MNALDEIAQKVTEFCVHNRISEEIKFDINLAIDELVTNTISYGYSNPEEKLIEISLEKTSNSVKIIITDDALPFNPFTRKDPDVSENDVDKRIIGGLGIYLVKKKMDEYLYSRSGDKNITTIIKNIPE